MTTIPYKNPLKDRTYISASILADILYRKFVLALPFFRQAEDYSMQGLELSRQVIIGWVNELEASDELRSEKLSKAVSYAINQEEYICRFLDDGNIPIDNGSSERYIASYSRGRANWLFADTILGAEVNAAMYSIVETAKAIECTGCQM